MAKSKPWWRDTRQLPPGTRDGGRHPMSEVEVWIVRIIVVTLSLAGVILLVMTGKLHALLLLGVPFGIRRLSEQHQQQVLGPLARRR